MLDLLAARYGADNIPDRAAPHEAVAALLRHRTVRDFRPNPLPDGALEAIIAAAQSAATSSNLQTWSVVAVEDDARKARLADHAGGQKQVRACPMLLMFVADLARLAAVGEALAQPTGGLDHFEMLLVAAIDAALAAQNAVVAAEAMGIATCYIGAMRNRPEAVAAELGLPPRSFVVFGLCLGYPAAGGEGAVKPRLPQAAVLHRERYDRAGQEAAILRYCDVMDRFYADQAMAVKGRWTEHSVKRVAGPESLSGRDRLMRALRGMGFLAAEA